MQHAARLATLVLVTLAVPTLAQAQDSHYWTYGYGPIGQLTEGTLVGGVSDLSATFYNPGALALLDKPRFVVGLTSVELATIDVPGVAGDGLNVDQLVFDIVPSMLAGHVGSHDGANHFAFAFLSRHDSDWDLGYSDVERLGGAARRSRRLRPRAPAARRVLGRAGPGRTASRDRLSVGISPFVAYRAQRSRRSLRSSRSRAATSGAAFVGSEYEYNHVRVLAKAGLAWRPGSWQLGMTVTAPGFGVMGQGKAVFNASFTGDVTNPIVSASTQKSLDATYHAPWSVAAGATLAPRRHRDPHDGRVVLRGGRLRHPAARAGSGRRAARRRSRSCTRARRTARRDYGLGFEQRVSSRLVLYGGAAHNESAYVPQRDSFAAVGPDRRDGRLHPRRRTAPRSRSAWATPGARTASRRRSSRRSRPSRPSCARHISAAGRSRSERAFVSGGTLRRVCYPAGAWCCSSPSTRAAGIAPRRGRSWRQRRRRAHPSSFRVESFQEMLLPLDLLRRTTGVSLEAAYNLILKHRASALMVPLLRLMHAGIRVRRRALVRTLADWLRAAPRPEAVVSVFPNFNGVLRDAVRRGDPGRAARRGAHRLRGLPATLLDRAGPRPRGRRLCRGRGAGARASGSPGERVSQVSGMILHPRFYRGAGPEVRDARAQRARGGPAGVQRSACSSAERARPRWRRSPKRCCSRIPPCA